MHDRRYQAVFHNVARKSQNKTVVAWLNLMVAAGTVILLVPCSWRWSQSAVHQQPPLLSLNRGERGDAVQYTDGIIAHNYIHPLYLLDYKREEKCINVPRIHNARLPMDVQLLFFLDCGSARETHPATVKKMSVKSRSDSVASSAADIC